MSTQYVHLIAAQIADPYSLPTEPWLMEDWARKATEAQRTREEKLQEIFKMAAADWRTRDDLESAIVLADSDIEAWALERGIKAGARAVLELLGMTTDPQKEGAL
jgi:antitoxin component of RelBE/YafQ-DinJ toxin-antitoxin module